MDFSINVVTVGKWKVNCYLIASGNEAWIVDPGDDSEKIEKSLQLNSYKLKGAINTHGHFDHIGAVAEIARKFDIPFYIHSRDKRLVNQGNFYGKLAGNSFLFETPKISHFLDDHPYLLLNEKRIFIHHTPGHTFGSVCFEIGNCLITGDLIFRDGIGRTDLPGGNREVLINSLREIYEKYIDYQIFPGHGPSFVLDKEIINSLFDTI